MKNITFWRKWLIVVSIFTIVYGLVVAFFWQSSLFNPINKQINMVFWNSTVSPQEFVMSQKFNLGVLGSVVAGWGILMAFIFFHVFHKMEKWMWNAVSISLIVWYIPDTIISIITNVYLNAIMNTLLLIFYMLPLSINRKYFVN